MVEVVEVVLGGSQIAGLDSSLGGTIGINLFVG